MSGATGGSVNSAAKKMGLLAVILLGINGIVGSGAFLLPQQIYQDAGFLLGIATLLAGGTATLFIVFCYADLASKVPGSGGGWLYCYTAWGRMTGFVVGIFVWFAGLATISTEIAALIRIFKNMVPALESYWVSSAIGIGVVIILAIINWFGANLVRWVDNISSGVKIATALFFVVAGAFFLKIANFKPIVPAKVTSLETGLEAVGSAYSVAFYLFAGFSFLTIVGNKMKNSEKNLPKALLIVIVAVTVVYSLIQFVTVGILGTGTAKSSIPVASAMQHVLGDWAYYLVIAGTAVAVFGVAFACSFEVPILAASLASEHDLLPPAFGKRNRHGAPSTAIIVTAILSSLMLLTGDYVFLATLVVCASAIQYIPTILAVWKLKDVPSAPGAFTLKGPARMIFVSLALIAASYLFLSFTWTVVLIISAVFLGSLLLYAYDEKRRGTPVTPATMVHALNSMATRAGAAVIDTSWLPVNFRLKAKAALEKGPAAASGVKLPPVVVKTPVVAPTQAAITEAQTAAEQSAAAAAEAKLAAQEAQRVLDELRSAHQAGQQQ